MRRIALVFAVALLSAFAVAQAPSVAKPAPKTQPVVEAPAKPVVKPAPPKTVPLSNFGKSTKKGAEQPGVLDAVPPGVDALLVVSGLEVSYGKAQVLFGVDMHVERGAFYAFLGPNGAGKSTTLAVLTGLYAADAGEVEILGDGELEIEGQVGRGVAR